MIRVEIGIMRGEDTIWPNDLSDLSEPSDLPYIFHALLTRAQKLGHEITGIKTRKEDDYDTALD